MPDRRDPNQVEQFSRRVTDVVATETSLLSKIGKWTLSLATTAVVGLGSVLYNQNQNVGRLEAANSLQAAKMDTLIAMVNEMRADLRNAPIAYFSRTEGQDHEQRIRQLERRR